MIVIASLRHAHAHESVSRTTGIQEQGYGRQIGSPWRKLSAGRQALLVLAYLRKGETFAELAGTPTWSSTAR